jgi:hypothetical protein
VQTASILSPATNAPATPGNVTESFGAIERRTAVETAAEVLAAQAKASIQARYIMAERRPRDMDGVRQKLLRECERSSFADSALYKKPVGNKTITGLSVRYAEAALRQMGNVDVAPAIIYDDITKRIVRVTVTDLETNATYSKDLMIEKTVERKTLRNGQQALSSRTNSYGDKVYLVEATEDDLITKEAAQMSKAIRQLGLRIVPGDLQDECLTAINSTIQRKVESDPDAEKKKLIDAFDDLGIRVEQLKDYLGLQDLASLTPKDLINLRGVYQAIKDGETNWREVMEQRDGARGTDAKNTDRAKDVLDKINNRNKQASPEAAVAAQIVDGVAGVFRDVAADRDAATEIPGVVTGKELFGKDKGGK